MICKYFRKRTKKKQIYFYCMTHRKNIQYKDCVTCKEKIFREYRKLKSKPLQDYKLKQHTLTKATQISLKVKKEVWERDNHKCVFCGMEVPLSNANSHFIKRSHLGKGIVENIFCACSRCHMRFDDSIERKTMLQVARNYLKNKHENWNEEDLIYRKVVK